MARNQRQIDKHVDDKITCQTCLPLEDCPLNRHCEECVFNQEFGCTCRNHVCAFKSCERAICGISGVAHCSNRDCPNFEARFLTLLFEDFTVPSDSGDLDLPEFHPSSREIRMVYPLSVRLPQVLGTLGDVRCVLFPIKSRQMMKRLVREGGARSLLRKSSDRPEDIQIGVCCVAPDRFLNSITSHEYNRWVTSIQPDFAFSYDAYVYQGYSKAAQWSRLVSSIICARDLAREVASSDASTGIIPLLTASDELQFAVGSRTLEDLGFNCVSHYFRGLYCSETYPSGLARARVNRWARVFRKACSDTKLIAYGVWRNHALESGCDYFVRFARYSEMN